MHTRVDKLRNLVVVLLGLLHFGLNMRCGLGFDRRRRFLFFGRGLIHALLGILPRRRLSLVHRSNRSSLVLPMS